MNLHAAPAGATNWKHETFRTRTDRFASSSLKQTCPPTPPGHVQPKSCPLLTRVRSLQKSEIKQNSFCTQRTSFCIDSAFTVLWFWSSQVCVRATSIWSFSPDKQRLWKTWVIVVLFRNAKQQRLRLNVGFSPKHGLSGAYLLKSGTSRVLRLWRTDYYRTYIRRFTVQTPKPTSCLIQDWTCGVGTSAVPRETTKQL